MIQVKPSIHNQVGFLWTPVHIDLAPQCLEDNLCYLEVIFFFSSKSGVSPFLSDAMASEYSIYIYMKYDESCLRGELFFVKFVSFVL